MSRDSPITDGSEKVGLTAVAINLIGAAIYWRGSRRAQPGQLPGAMPVK
jgi:hypothetical protein